MEKKVVIQGKGLSIGYRTGKQEKTVHEKLNFQLHAGELTCLLGAMELENQPCYAHFRLFSHRWVES